MPFFTKKERGDVQSFLLQITNNDCLKRIVQVEGPRVESRVNLTVAVLVIPVEKGQPVLDRTFSAVTSDFSTTGVSIVLNRPEGLDKVILAFRWKHKFSFLRGKATHLNPMGAGFFQLGVELNEMVYLGDCPELRSVTF